MVTKVLMDGENSAKPEIITIRYKINTMSRHRDVFYTTNSPWPAILLVRRPLDKNENEAAYPVCTKSMVDF